MAHLGRKGQVYMARFRFMGREYKRSLKTTDSRDAKAALHSIELTIHRLITGAIELPEAADPGAFIVSGGKLLTAPQRVKPESIPSVTAAINEYTGSSLGHLAESNRATIRTHLRNLEGHLGAKVDRALDRITLRDLEGFIESRLHKRASSTVQKERMTIVGFFRWARLQTYVPASVAENLRTIKASGDQRPFRTVQEIEVVIERGGLEPEEALELWDCLYLTPEEIKSVLEIVAERGRSDVSLLLHTVPAYTGMRRGEILRLRWSDVEFDQDSLVARSRKQSRQQV
jgi:integrase